VVGKVSKYFGVDSLLESSCSLELPSQREVDMDKPVRLSQVLSRNKAQRDKQSFRFLTRLNASSLMDPEALSKRFVRTEAEPLSEEQARVRDERDERLRPNVNILMYCVHGLDFGFLTQSLCEGRMIRLALGARTMSDMFGYIEGWLCLASRLVEHSVLQPVFRLLPDIHSYLVDSRFGDEVTEEGKRTEGSGPSREEELYSRLCVLVFEARSHLPRGCYEMVDPDFDIEKFVDSGVVNAALMDPRGGDRAVIDSILHWHRNTELAWAGAYDVVDGMEGLSLSFRRSLVGACAEGGS